MCIYAYFVHKKHTHAYVHFYVSRGKVNLIRDTLTINALNISWTQYLLFKNLQCINIIYDYRYYCDFEMLFNLCIQID